MTKEKIKEIHHYHYYPCYIPQVSRYPVWHGIVPPLAFQPNWYYEPTITTTTFPTTKVERYDSI